MSLRYGKWGRVSLIFFSAFSMISQAKAAETSGFEVYGFAQVDYIQDFNRVNPKWQDTLRPSKIPSTDGQFGSDGQAMLSVKQSRLGVQSTLPVEGKNLYTKFEFDFFGVGVDEGQTTPRLRHAYGQWGDWLGGMTHSLFMDADLFPNVIDYWGPTGMVFYRLPQIRWMPMQGDTSLSFAIEKPGDDIDVGLLRTLDPNVSANIQTDEKVPDLTAQWRTSGTWGHVQLAGIYRRIGYETTTTADHEPNGQKDGWGIDVTSVLKFRDKEKLYLGVVTGEGIASYMNDGGTDLGPEGSSLVDLSTKVIPLTGLIAYYEHAWNEKWTSSIGFSQTEVKNSSLQAPDAYNRGQYVSANALFTPQKNMLAGAEFLWGSRRSNDGTTNDDSRIQISMKYSFSSKDF